MAATAASIPNTPALTQLWGKHDSRICNPSRFGAFFVSHNPEPDPNPIADCKPQPKIDQIGHFESPAPQIVEFDTNSEKLALELPKSFRIPLKGSIKDPEPAGSWFRPITETST